MTYGELISLNSGRVRNESNLTNYFMNAYNNIFGNFPSCTGCAINNEFNKLIQQVKTKGIQQDEIEIKQNNITMVDESKTFVLSPNTDDYMLVYTDKDKRDRRKFLTRLTDEYVVAYLTNGTTEEIEERKKKFKVLPLALREKAEKQVLKTKEKKNK